MRGMKNINDTGWVGWREGQVVGQVVGQVLSGVRGVRGMKAVVTSALADSRFPCGAG